LRSTYDILTDLAKVWGDLDDESQSYLGFLASGQRQSPVLISLLNNMSNAISATEVSVNSAGSAMKEFEKVQESIQGRLDAFGATWSRIATEFISSDFVKGLLDTANGVSKVVEGVGFLNTALLVTSGIMGAKGFITVFDGLAVALGRFTMSATGSAVAASALSSALVTLAPVAVVGTIIGLVKLFDHLNVTTEESIANINKLNKEISNAGTDLKSIEDLSKTYDELKNKTELTAEEAEEFKRIQNELGDIMPDMVAYYDSNGNAVLKLSANYEELVAIQKEYLEGLKAERRESAIEGLGNLGDYRQQIQIIEFQEKALEDLEKRYNEGKISSDEYKESQDRINEAIYKELAVMNQADAKFKQFTATIISTTDGFDKLTEAQKQSIIEQFQSIDTTKMSVDEFNNLKNTLIDTVKQTVAGVHSYDELDYAMREAVDTVDDLNDSVEDVNKTFEDQTDILSSLASEFDNINNSEEVSVETLLELINKYPEYIDYLFKEESLKKGAIKLTEALFEIEKQKSIEILKGKMAELIAEDALMDAERNRLRMLAQAGEISWGEVYDAESNTDEIIRLIGAISGLESATVDSFNGISESTSKSTTSTKEYISTITDLTELERELQEIRDEASVRGIDSRQEEIAKIKQIQAELHRLNNEDRDRLSNIEQGTQEYDDLYSTIISRSQKWYDLERDILDINKEITDELEAQAEKNRELARLAEERMDAKNQEALDKAKEFAEVQMDNARDAIDALRDEMDLIDDLYDSKLDALEEEQELKETIRKEAENELKTQELLLAIEKARLKLSNVKKERNVRLLTEDGWQWVANPKDVADAEEELRNAQEDYNDWQRTLQEEHEDALYASKKEALEKERDLEKESLQIAIDAYENFIDNTSNMWDDYFDKRIQSISELQQALESLGATSTTVANAMELANKSIFGGDGIAENISTGGSFGSGNGSSGNNVVTGSTEPSTAIQQDRTYEAEYRDYVERNKGKKILSYVDFVKEGYGIDLPPITSGEMQFVNVRRKSTGMEFQVPLEYYNDPANGWQTDDFERFKDGGVVNSDGLAYLDGANKPEVVLNDSYAGRLWNFVDKIIPNIDLQPKLTMDSIGSKGGDNYNITIKSDGRDFNTLVQQAKIQARNGR